MAHSSLSSVADGSTNIFTVDFPYINKAYVKVYKDGALVDPSTLTWPSAGQVQLPDAAASLAGKTILRKRESPLDAALATFLAGPLDVTALNTVISQMLHLAVEARDGYSSSSVTWRGAWSGTYSYVINDIASYGGSSYRSLVSDNLNVTPGTDAAKWQIVASKGDVGTTAWGDLTGVPATFPPSAHNHDSSYYTEAEVNTLLGGKADKSGATFTGAILSPAGTAAAPSLAAAGDVDTGVYYPAPNEMAVATGGVERLRIDSTGAFNSFFDQFMAANKGYKLRDTTGAWASGSAGGLLLQGGGGVLFLDSYGGAIQFRGASFVSLGNLTSTLATFNSVKVSSFTVAGLPSASTYGAGAVIYVSNEAGGATIAFSDGTNWRRVIDRAVVA